MTGENTDLETDWIEGTVLWDIGYAFEGEPESVCGYKLTKEHRLLRAMTTLIRQYGGQVRSQKFEHSWQPQNKELQRQIAVFGSRYDFVAALLGPLYEEENVFFHGGIFPELVNQQKDTIPCWMQGSVFEEIRAAYCKNFSVAITRSLPAGVEWKYFGKLSRLMKAAYYVVDQYRDEIIKMKSEDTGEWRAIRKRRLLESRLAVAHEFYRNLLREDTSSIPGSIAWAITDGDKIFLTEDREVFVIMMERKFADV